MERTAIGFQYELTVRRHVSGHRLSLGCIDIYERAATGAIFSQIKERGATHTGRLLATIDTEMRKNGPVPSGCGAN